MQAEQLSGVIAYHTESPLWWPEWGLRICDGYSGDIVGIDSKTGGVTSRTHVGEYAGAFRPRAGGGLVVGIEGGFALVDSAGGVDPLPRLWDDRGLRMNDGACDWLGNFYSGRLRETEPREGLGAVFRLGDPSADVEVVLSEQDIPNGLVFDKSRGAVFYVDTLTRSIQRFDYDETALSWVNPRVSVDLTHLEAYPDGMTIDADGRLWVALWGAGAVHCYDPGSNRVLERIEVAEAKNTSAVTFGGDALTTLYITTSQQGGEAGRLAGAVFAADPGVRGIQPLSYGY